MSKVTCPQCGGEMHPARTADYMGCPTCEVWWTGHEVLASAQVDPQERRLSEDAWMLFKATCRYPHRPEYR